MFLTEISIRRPVFTAMVTVALMTLGLLGARSLGVDLYPKVDFPVTVVVTAYPGAGPEEIEQLVAKPIEEAVSAVNGVEKVRSFSRDSVSTVIVEFGLSVDAKDAASDVRDRLAAARGKLPAEIEDPVVQRFDFAALPVVVYALAGRDPAEARRFAEDVVKPRFEAVDGVAGVTVVGGLRREVRLLADPARLEAHGLSLAGLAQQLGAESFDLPAGRIDSGAAETSVTTRGRFRSLDELRGVVVASLPSGAQVRLGDVATVVDGFEEVRTRSRLDGSDAVLLEVQKQGGSNSVAIADALYRVADRLEGQLPADVKLYRALDQTQFIRGNVRDVTEAIFFGGAMAILVIFVFMLDWRSTFISSLALPTSVVTTFLVMWWAGFTFNMMTLMALSLAIGLLIDDAVVVRENIYRHMERGEDPMTAARNGTKEIGLAVMATTFTIVAVFVPVAFMGGVVGQFFKEFGITVTAAVLVSLFVSFTLDPMMSARVMKPMAPGHHERVRAHRVLGRIVRALDAVEASYRGLLAWALRHRKTVVAAATALFVGALALVPLMGAEFLAEEDRGEFRIALEAPAGTSLAEMDRVTGAVEAAVREHREIRSLVTTVGPGGEANKAYVNVFTSKKQERGESLWQIQGALRRRLQTFPALKVAFAQLDYGGGPPEQPVTLFLRGEDYGALQQAAMRALDVVERTRGVKDADSSLRPGRPEVEIRVDRARAADLGTGVGAVARTARLALEGEVVGKFRDGERDRDVRLQLAPEARATAEALASLTVPALARGGRLVELGEVADVAPGTGPATIERMNRQRQVTISAGLDGRSLGEVVAELDRTLPPVTGEGVRLVWGGQGEMMQDTFANMLVALLVAVLFIYFVLASQFESFVHPLTIMVSLPLAIVGALLLLFLSGFAIGLPAMIGVILLMGLVTKNAILLVDSANALRDGGASVVEALLQAGATRLRPILMTSAAMVLGMLPAALSRGDGSEFRAPMAVAVIGGVVASTFLTLVVVPVVYTWMDRLTIRGRAARRAERAREGAALQTERIAA
ncbi:MAG TPA: efflux RND transporter permease subunit [Anaeromyxobacter sp.]|nr:efflux RND transporter permease subunit [Anaeromyxobacter sp.]